MSIIEINQKTCNKCGICAAECPRRIITLPDGGFPEIAAQVEAACNGCGHCVAVCPKGSLSHRDSPLGLSPKIQDGLKITSEQVEQLLKSRRSARAFKNKPVPREVITRLIEDARYAPTGHNTQEVEWLVIDNKKELDRIEEVGIDWMRWVIQNMPKQAAEANMEEKLERQKLHHDAFLRGAPVLIVTHASKDNPNALVAAIDSANALSFLDLAANGLGLATCWAGYVYFMANLFPPVQEVLALPEGHTAYGCVMLGYNKFKYHRIPARKVPRIIWR
ncbi:MAG: nitroreductase family protein [Dehalococcoidia bacterium]|nr:nitroreductase family protein [Dehalococcoidia bacterium]